MPTRSPAVFYAAIALLGSGCAAHVPYQTYEASLQLAQEESAEQASRVQLLNDQANRTLTKEGITVAFFPPDECRQVSATPLTSRQTDSFLSMSCGPLISALERTAATRGYEVVSWQFLKEGNTVSQARDNGVDIIFEVDQLSTNAGDKAVDRITRVDFSGSYDGLLQVRNPQEVGQRCVNLMAGSLSSAQGDSVTLAVKAVDVGSGRALWYYSKTMGDTSRQQRRNYDVTFWPERRLGTHSGGGLALWLPGIFAAVGGLALLGYGLADDELGTAGGGFLLGAAGAGMITLGLVWDIQAGHPKRQPLEEPDLVLCNPNRLEMPDPDRHYIPRDMRVGSYTREASTGSGWVPGAQPTASSSGYGSSFTATQSTGPQEDLVMKRKLELVELAVEDLFTELSRL